MNVGLVVETPVPPVSRANIRLYNLGLSLAKRDHKVFMITPSTSPYSRTCKKHSGIIIYQYPGFARYLYSRMRMFVRFIHLVFSIISVILLNSKNKIDVIHAWNPLAGLAAVISGKLIRARVFIDLTDFYSDIAKDDSPLLVPFFRKIENYILKSATKVIVVSEETSKILVKTGISKKKICIVPDGVDHRMFNPEVDGRIIRKRYNIEDNPVLIFHGDIKPPDGIDVLIGAFKNVVREKPEVKLFIIGGGGDYYNKIVKGVKGDDVLEKNIIFTGWIPHKEVPKYIAASDVGMMPLRATLNHNCYLSFKLFEYWGVGKPVIISRLKALSRIVKDRDNGLIVEPENEKELADAIISILENKEQSRVMGRNGRKLVEKEFNWERIMEREADLYKTI